MRALPLPALLFVWLHPALAALTVVCLVTPVCAQPTDEVIASQNERLSQNERVSQKEQQTLVDPADVGRIDGHLQDKWNAAGIVPAAACDDQTFARRVYLDLAGRIPSVAEQRAFVADERPDKHQRLIDLLLHSEDYVQHFADVFDTLLMGRGSKDKYAQRHSSQWRAYLERVFRDNRPWDQVTREILLARPERKSDRGLVWFLYERNNKPQEIAEAVAPAFFGIRIECAQCHDHMIADEIEQAHYWGLVAFFNRGTNSKSDWGPSVKESAIGGFSEFASLDGSSYPNRLTFFRAKTIDEQRPQAGAKQEDKDEFYRDARHANGNRVPLFSRREKFVNEIVADHPLIARAFVNRVWALVLGRGLVHPFDEMDSVHEPSHPELLDWLAEEFRRTKYDIRHLVGLVVSCRAYRLSSQQPPGVEDRATFAWYLERPLTAEQYVRSVQQAVSESFRNDHQLLVEVRDRLTDVLPDESVTTVKEALFLTNNAALNDYLSDPDSVTRLLDELLAQDDVRQQVDTVVQRMFGRVATDQEHSELAAFLPGGDERDLRHRWRMALWAMLTSSEFRFNH